MKTFLVLLLTGSCVAMSAVGCGEDDVVDGNPDGGGTSSSSGGKSSSSGDGGGSSSSSGDGGGSSSSSGDGGGSNGEWTATCDAQAAATFACNPQSTLAAEKAYCLEEATCFDAALRPGAAAALSACLNARECDTSTDPCYAETGLTVGGPAVQAYSDACFAKLDACGDGAGFDVDHCNTNIGLYKESLLASSSACLSSDDCSGVNDCMEAAIAALSPVCFN